MNRRRKNSGYNKNTASRPGPFKSGADVAHLVRQGLRQPQQGGGSTGTYVSDEDFNKTLARLRKQMTEAAGKLDFEQAAVLRDRMLALERRKLELGI